MPDLPPRSRPPRESRPARTRATSTARGYNYAWRGIRERKLHAQPVCEMGLEGCRGLATVVHHRDENTSNNRPENLCSACKFCHDLHHRLERGRRS